jgi:N-formylglutamate amidohydrolase
MPGVQRNFAEIEEGPGPLAAAAVHHGHDLREEVEGLMALGEPDRLREEDPHTGIWTRVVPTRLVANRSRFEVDLNRPRHKAVYRSPEDAWGLEVWSAPPPDDLVARSLREYDAFYAEARRIFSGMQRRFGHFVVLDLHSYNHRRGGPGAAPEDPAGNPEINVGTGTLDRSRWALLIDRFIGDLGAFGFPGRRLDVRENVRFRGGQLPRWMHENFPDSACCLAVEVKKFFMDEWSGRLSAEEFEAVPRALESTLPGLRESLAKIARSER